MKTEIDLQQIKQQRARLLGLAGDFVQAAKIAGIKKQGVTNWFSRSGIPKNPAEKISEYYGVSIDWLLTGRGSKYLNDSNAGLALEKVSKIPLVSWVQAGTWDDISDAFQPGYAEEYYSAPENFGPYTFALKVIGESMSPDYIDGEIIFVDPEIEARNGSCVVVRQNGDNDATFKQLVVDNDGKRLKALNPDWKPKYIELLPDAVISGVVIGSYRKRN